jgi:adenosylcobinamide-GDP ribazoletransferase
MVRFYSRLPVGRLPFEGDAHAVPDFRTAPRLLPVAGLIIGIPPALILWAALRLGLPPLIASALAVATALIVSGALHEDGLADTFDGLVGGWNRERRLEIMKDSRIGSYGAAALILSLLMRAAALAAIADRFGPGTASVFMLTAASWSRTIALTPLLLLPPARAEGFSSTVGRPTASTFAIAIGLAMVIAFAPFLTLSPSRSGIFLGLTLGLMLGAVVALLMSQWAWRTIRGQTGDIVGACQQLAEIAFYVGLLIVLPNE